MMLLHVERRVVKPRSRQVCELRQHCGPFVNEDYYDAFPEAFWHGMGDCVECGTTRKVADEVEAARAAA